MATITFDQTTLSPAGIVNRSRSDGLINGSEVTVTVNEPGVVTFVDVPEGDTTSVSSLHQASPLAWKFTPTAGIYGSWLIEFKPTAVQNQPVRRIFAVRSPSKALRIPAFNEHASSKATVANGSSLVDSSDNNEGGSYRGWAPALAELYKTVVSAPVVLTNNLTVYVSASGDDANAGTQAAPFKTLARAFVDRAQYAVRDCVYTIQLVGAGPFPLPPGISGGWVHLGTGVTALRGDAAVRTVHMTGTAAGDFVGSTPVINVSAGMGTDTHVGRFVRFTSGNLTGFVFQIAENTDTSLTTLDRLARNQVALPVATGDSFEIFTPGTVLQLASGSTFGNIVGGTSGGGGGLLLENFQTTGSILSFMRTVVMPCVVKFGSGANMTDTNLYTGMADARPLGLPQFALQSTSCWFASTFSIYGESYGLFGAVFDGAFGVNDQSSVQMTKGFRFNAPVTVRIGALQIGVAVVTGLWNATINVLWGGFLRATYTSANGVARCTVTSGDVLRVKHGGFAIMENSVAWPGGTTGAGGYGVNVSDGGKFLCTSAPTWTGGTAGKDLKTTNNGGVANSVLSATGTTAGNATDALLGEVLARVTA